MLHGINEKIHGTMNTRIVNKLPNDCEGFMDNKIMLSKWSVCAAENLPGFIEKNSAKQISGEFSMKKDVRNPAGVCCERHEIAPRYEKRRNWILESNYRPRARHTETIQFKNISDAVFTVHYEEHWRGWMWWLKRCARAIDRRHGMQRSVGGTKRHDADCHRGVKDDARTTIRGIRWNVE